MCLIIEGILTLYVFGIVHYIVYLRFLIIMFSAFGINGLYSKH